MKIFLKCIKDEDACLTVGKIYEMKTYSYTKNWSKPVIGVIGDDDVMYIFTGDMFKIERIEN